MKKKIKKKIESVLCNINLNQEAINYFLDIIDYCKKNKIHKLDINLTKNIYPMLSKKKNISADAIEGKLIKALKHSYDISGPVVYLKNIGYDKRISIKKLLIILITKVEEEEMETIKEK